MGRNKGAWSKDRGATPTKRVGLRLLAFIASVSLMVVGFGALGGTPASAEPGGQGGGDIYAPNQCADGFDFKDGKCVKTTSYTPVPPAVSYTGTCGLIAGADEAATEDGVTAETWLGYTFDPATGKCKKDGWPDLPARNVEIVLTCDTANGWYLGTPPRAAEDAEAQNHPAKMCLKDDTYEYADPTCREGDTLVGADASATHEHPKGALCYTPKAYCEKITGGVWGPSGDPRDSGKDNGRDGKCWLPITFDICQFTLADHPKDHDAEDSSNRPGDKPKPVPTGTYALVTVKADYNHGQYYAPRFGPLDITPLVQDPADAHHNVSVARGDQAFLTRGCKDAVPVTPVVPGGPTPVKDYCSNIAGVQWENYDCATGGTPQAVAAAEAVAPVVAPAPATVVTPAKKPTKKPAKVTVVAPAAATVPSAVPAGGGATAPSDALPTWALLMIVIGGLGVAASGMRLAGSHLRR